MNEKAVSNWRELGSYDFETAKAMLAAGRYSLYKRTEELIRWIEAEIGQ